MHIKIPQNEHARQTCCAKVKQFVGKQWQPNGHMVELGRAYAPSSGLFFHRHDRPRPTSPGRESTSMHLSNNSPLLTVCAAMIAVRVRIYSVYYVPQNSGTHEAYGDSSRPKLYGMKVRDTSVFSPTAGLFDSADDISCDLFI